MYPIIGVATIIVSTGYFCLGISNPKVLNAKSDLVKETDKEKAEAGEGIFSIVESDLKNFATDVAPTTPDTEKKDDTNKKVVDDKKATTGFKSWSTTKKAIVVGSGLAVLGLAVWYFVIRKK